MAKKFRELAEEVMTVDQMLFKEEIPEPLPPGKRRRSLDPKVIRGDEHQYGQRAMNWVHDNAGGLAAGAGVAAAGAAGYGAYKYLKNRKEKKMMKAAMMVKKKK